MELPGEEFHVWAVPRQPLALGYWLLLSQTQLGHPTPEPGCGVLT